MGSVCFFTHFLRAQGFTRPQKPSLAGVMGGVAVVAVPVVCCVAAGGALCGVVADCASCAIAGIPIADASRITASWPGNGVIIAVLDFMGFVLPRHVYFANLEDSRVELCCRLAHEDSNGRAKAACQSPVS